MISAGSITGILKRSCGKKIKLVAMADPARSQSPGVLARRRGIKVRVARLPSLERPKLEADPTQLFRMRPGTAFKVLNFAVAPSHRRRGHYRRMHEHVRALAARDPDVCGLRLYVEQDNRPARTTYERLGMRETQYRLYEEPMRRTR